MYVVMLDKGALYFPFGMVRIGILSCMVMLAKGGFVFSFRYGKDWYLIMHGDAR